ncbi:MAG: hypothetical protein LBI27_10110 [Clostridiales bacterium]|jgi:hypothetical protein|nr:hypothetical protein [Clostridiales bacterium]
MNKNDLLETHPFTRYGKCPCRPEKDVIEKTGEIFRKSKDTASFVEELEKSRIKGKKIWFDAEQNTIFISKPFACESGGGCAENDSLIGKGCHCDHYNREKEFYPKHYCQCGAEYYRPMFEPLFGKKIELYPHKTILSGDGECVIAVKLI